MIEPHYGFPLVVCPECSRSTVRRPEALTAQWREGARIFAAVRTVVLRILAGAILMGASVGIVFMLEGEAESRRLSILGMPAVMFGRDAGWFETDDWAWAVIFLLAWAGVQAGVGVLLSVGLAHWRPRVLPWVVWGALLVLCLSLVPATYPLRAALGWMLSDPLAYDGPRLDVWSGRIVVGLAAMAAAPTGIVFGWGLVWLGEQVRRLKFRVRRRRHGRERGFGG